MEASSAGRPAPEGPGQPERVSRRLAVFLASGAGAGFFPFAPGTAGTLVGVLLWWGLSSQEIWAQALVSGSLFLLGWWASGVSEAVYRRRDPQFVVIDEVVGFLVATAGLAFGWLQVLGGFLLFRVLDIVKPWPAGLVDRRVPGGLGVMLDDVVAGLYARLVLEVLLRAYP